MTQLFHRLDAIHWLLQLERNALEGALVARNAEVTQLQGDNKRLTNDWSRREESLTSAHELRVSTLLSDLTARDKQNSDLHNALHKCGIELQSCKNNLENLHLEFQVLLCWSSHSRVAT